jgi:shikimate kinase
LTIDVEPFSDLGLAASRGAHRPAAGSNIILIGASGAGKTKVGFLLAKLLGYGFLDLDQIIEGNARATTEAIFSSHGEEHFRRLETAAITALRGLRSHVIATGGGAVLAEGNWDQLARLGTIVWLSTPADEIARRLIGSEAEMAKRPLLAEVLAVADPEARLRLLTERISALIGNRLEFYRQADLVVADSFSTPESTAQRVRFALQQASVLSPSIEQQPYDRWHVL